MLIFVPREIQAGETRATLVPVSIEKMKKKGINLVVESDIGKSIGRSDEEYATAGAEVSNDRKGMLSKADVILRLNKPPKEEVHILKKGCIHISRLDPFDDKYLLEDLARSRITTFSLEMIPRTTIAQKMDVLSSQASLAGYVAVILAAERINKIFPMMTTPSGTIRPARVFVIGVGVAGLQAIATAKRLGARVEAYDIRPAVEEEVKSLGAKFVKIDLGVTRQTTYGYAKELAPEQLEKQKDAMTDHCAKADVVITTALVFGRKANILVTRDMISQMKPETVIVDMAVEKGGNVEGSQIDQEVYVEGVKVIGISRLPRWVAKDASRMFSANIRNFVEHLWDPETKQININMEDEITKGCLVTRNGQISNERL